MPGGGCFCGLHCAPILCGPQNQVLAKPMPHRPALLDGPYTQATNRHAHGIGRLGLPGLPRLMAFLALALCAHFMRAPKLSFGQACAPAPSFACWALHAGHQRAYQWPQPPSPTWFALAAGVFGNCTALCTRRHGAAMWAAVVGPCCCSGPAGPVGRGPWLTHGQLEAPNPLSRPTLARPPGVLADALCFCQCGAQSQALARLWPRGPAQPGGARAQLTNGQAKAPNHPSWPMLARVLAFLANALHFSALCYHAK